MRGNFMLIFYLMAGFLFILLVISIGSKLFPA